MSSQMAADRIHPEVVCAQKALLDRWRRKLSEGHSRVGWKIGHAIAEIEVLAQDCPVVGYLTSATLLRSGDTYSAHRAKALRAETEIVLELGCDVSSAATGSAIHEAIRGMGVALELVDVSRPPRDVAGIVAGNVFHRAAVFGTLQVGAAMRIGRATLTLNDHVHDADEQPRNLGAVIRDVARMLEACGEHLVAGDRILAGSLVDVPVEREGRATARICGLGDATLFIAC